MITKMILFENFYMIMKILSQVSYMCHSKLVSNNHHRILRILFVCQPIFNCFAAHFSTNSIVPREYFS